MSIIRKILIIMVVSLAASLAISITGPTPAQAQGDEVILDPPGNTVEPGLPDLDNLRGSPKDCCIFYFGDGSTVDFLNCIDDKVGLNAGDAFEARINRVSNVHQEATFLDRFCGEKGGYNDK